jgi:hypothetical protein
MQAQLSDWENMEAINTSSKGVLAAHDSESAPGTFRQSNRGFSRAMWDLEFNYSSGDSAGANGQAAVILTPGGEFWTSRWQNDTIYRFNTSGQFLGPFTISNGAQTLSGIRAMTTDGTSIFAVNNTRTIFTIDPVRRTVTSQVTALASIDLRYITYDPTANSGLGGFWVGNFSTDINLVARNGGVLQTIPASTHDLESVYSAVIDNASTGGPYLWVFTHSGGASQANIIQVDVNTGRQTGIMREVTADLGEAPEDLGGGLFLTDQLFAGKTTLIGLLQGGPNRIFGYDVDFSQVGIDAAIYPAYFADSYSQIPEAMVPGVGFTGIVRMQGNQTVNSLEAYFDVFDDNGTFVYSDNQALNNVPPATNGTLPFTGWDPSPGVYSPIIELTTPGQVDEDTTNNILALQEVVVSDSILAYDDGIASPNGYSATGAGGPEAFAVTRYRFPADAYVKGIQVEITNPTSGQITYPILVSIDGMTFRPVGSPVLRGPNVRLRNGVNTYFLEFDEPYNIIEGEFWAFGLLEEAGERIDLAQSTGNFRPGTNFFSRSTTNPDWLESTISTNRFIRPVIASCKNFSIDLVAVTPDTGATGGSATIRVNGVNGELYLLWNDPSRQDSLTATGLSAGEYRVVAADDIGCIDTLELSIPATVGIEQSFVDQLEIFPIPASDKLSVSGLLKEAETLEISILSMEGKLLQTEKVETGRALNAEISVSSLNPGTYVLQLKTSDGSTTYRQISVI